MPANKPATPKQISAAVTALRAFWRKGRKSWAAVNATAPPAARTKRSKGDSSRSGPTGHVYGHKLEVLKRAAADAGMNHDTLAKAWKASKLYMRDQIEELCALVKRHRARFAPTHLTRVMAVVDENARDRLTRRAIRRRWG